MKPQVQPEHYFGEDYLSKKRFISYWHQIHEISSRKPQSILEIGIGNGFVSDYLKHIGYNITTIDIDRRLHPDIVGSVLDIPLQDKSFDLVACFEVLEHIPYDRFTQALSELHRISSNYVLLSMPNCARVYPIYFPILKWDERKTLIPLPRLKQTLIPLPRLKPPQHKFNGEHYWEIGKAGYSIENVTKKIKISGFEIVSNYRVFENPSHHFFVLNKI